MSLCNELIEMLVCPESKQPVMLADSGLVKETNAKIRKREVRNRLGEIITAEISDLLICKDKIYAYPVRDDIPIMLSDEALIMSDL